MMGKPLQPLALAAVLGMLAACGDSTPTATTAPEPEPPLPPVAVERIWLKGDLHVHNDHSSDGSALRQLADDRGPGNTGIVDQIAFARLGGLDFLPFTDHRTYDQHYDPLWESGALLLVPGEEANGSPHATVHGGVESVVQGSEDGDELRRLQQSVWDAHAQGAVWITAHPDDGMVESDGTPNRRASVVGIDLVETWNRASDVEKEIDYAENRWNAGFRFGVAGASDNHFRELWLVSGPGLPTTQVLAEGRSERGLLQGMRAGRTRLHADALAPVASLEADFDGDGSFEAVGGDERFVAPGTPGKLRVTVENGMGTNVYLYAAPGRSQAPLASFRPGLLELRAQYDVDVAAPEAPTWYRAEVRGFSLPHSFDTTDIPVSLIPLPQELPNQLRATTSPIFVSAAPVEAQPEHPAPADSGIDDGAVAALGSVGAFSGFPDLAVAEGRSHVVAEVHTPGATLVQYRRRDGGRWSEAQILSASTAARFPQVAALGARVWVVWQDEGAGQQPRRPAVLMRRSTDGGGTWGDIETLRAIDGRAERPAIAVTPAGEALVAWQEIRSGEPFDVYAQLLGRDAAPVNLSREGKSFRAANALDTRSSLYPASVWPRVAVGGDGRLAVGWQDNRTDIDPLWTGQSFRGEGTDPDNWQIMLRQRDADSDTWRAPQSLGADDQADRHPALAFDSARRLVVAWESKPLRASGANLVVLASSENAAGEFAVPSPIAAGEIGMGQYVRLGRDADGSVRAVWADSRSTDWRWRVMTARLDGGAWTGARLVPSRGNNTWPATASGQIVFASTRNAQRMQRDPTQQVMLLNAGR
jgi:hypothetical protein